MTKNQLKSNAYAVLVAGISLCIIGGASIVYAAALNERLAGRIVLQVESKGEAWYVNPVDGKRYSLGSPAQALAVLRTVGLGITDKDLAQIPIFQNPGPAAMAKPAPLITPPSRTQAHPISSSKFIVTADEKGATITTESGAPAKISVKRGTPIEIVFRVADTVPRGGIDFLDYQGSYLGVIKPGESKSYFITPQRSRIITPDYPDHKGKYPYSLSVNIY